MPHIVNFREKCALVKPKYMDWSIDLKKKYISPTATSTENYWGDMRYSTKKLLKIIEDIVEQTLPQTMDDFFDQFVDIKEVPYGRYNSDTNH